MGSSLSVNTTTNKNQTINKFVQTSESECLSVANNTVRGVTVNNFDDIGDIEIIQKATGSADCVIDTNLNAVAQSAFDAVTENESAAPKLLTFGISVNTTTNINELENDIRQSMVQRCNATAQNLAEDITFNNYGTAGDFRISQEANPSASCVINNMAQIATVSEFNADTENKSGTKTIGFIVLVVVIGIVLVTLIAALAGVMSGKKNNEACDPDPCARFAGTDGYKECRRLNPMNPDKPYCPIPKTEGSSGEKAVVSSL